MTEYEMIESYLQEAVNNDIYTEEFANEVLELAYDKYVKESNAYNRYIDDKRKQYKDLKEKEKELYKRDRAYSNSGLYKRNPKLADKYDDKIEDNKKKLDKVSNTLKDNGAVPKQLHAFYNSRSNKTKSPYPDKYAEKKKEWMKSHGDQGSYPEDKYRPGRYLKAQEELRK